MPSSMPTSTTLDVLQFFPTWFHQGGPLMWPLLLCSLLVLTVSMERAWFWLRFRPRLDDSGVNRALQLLRQQHTEQAQELARHSRDPALLMLGSGLAQPAGEAFGQLLASAAKQQLNSMRRGQPLLDTVITVAPMLGILGTVLGIIDSFKVLGDVGVEDPRAVVGGIAQALITTAAGLAVAVLALLPHNRFRHLLQQQALRLEQIGSQIEACIAAPANDSANNSRPLKVLNRAAG